MAKVRSLIGLNTSNKYKQKAQSYFFICVHLLVVVSVSNFLLALLPLRDFGFISFNLLILQRIIMLLSLSILQSEPPLLQLGALLLTHKR